MDSVDGGRPRFMSGPWALYFWALGPGGMGPGPFISGPWALGPSFLGPGPFISEVVDDERRRTAANRTVPFRSGSIENPFRSGPGRSKICAGSIRAGSHLGSKMRAGPGKEHPW